VILTLGEIVLFGAIVTFYVLLFDGAGLLIVIDPFLGVVVTGCMSGCPSGFIEPS
jgi:hypothetical protein